jgi:two-component system cell cycle response regulator DivK
MRQVLVVDDKPSSRELLRTVLESSGYEVSEAGDGQEAVRIAQQIEPDAIFLDLQMPALDGFGALERLRADPRFVALPIIALTANAMQGDREKALAAGFTSYISKPVTLKTLRAELTRLLPD